MSISSIIKEIKQKIILSDTNTNKLIFVHVPKCGGRSLEDAIKKGINIQDVNKEYVRIDSKRSAKMSSILYKTDYTNGDINDYDILNFSQEYLVYSLSNNNIKFISGHCPFNNITFEAFKHQYKYVTVLRDPVKKWFSNFNFRKYRESDHWKIDEDIHEYLKTDRGRYHGYDYAKYYGGIRKDNNYHSREVIENAKNNLHLFSAVGILENMIDLKGKFKNTFNINLNIQSKNVTQKSNEYKHDQQIIKQIEEICSTDMEIYNYAVKNFING